MKIRLLGAATALALVGAALTPALSAQAASGTLSGTVNYSGSAKSGIAVNWYKPSTGEVGSYSYTDSNGDYSLALPTGGSKFYVFANLGGLDYDYTYVNDQTYVGVFYGSGNKRDYAYQTLTPYTSSASDRTVDIALVKPGKIAGTASTLKGSYVYLQTLGGDTVTSETVSSSGKFNFTNLVPGRYRVSVEGKGKYLDATTTATVSAGKSKSVKVTAKAGGTIKGKVTSSGKAAKKVPVYAYPTSGSNTSYASDTSDSKGRYSLEGLSSGTYTVYYGGIGTSSSYAPKTVTVKSVKAGKSKTVNTKVTKGGSISGSVKTSGSTATYVTVTNSKDLQVDSEYLGASKSTEKFSIKGLAAGKYTVVVTDDKGKKYAKKSVSVRAGKTAKTGTLKLSKNTVTLKGKVTGASDPTGYVYVGNYAGGSIARSGKYTVKGVVPGKQSVSVVTASNAYKIYSVNVTKSATKNFKAGKANGKVTGTVKLAGEKVSYGSLNSGTAANYAYLSITNGKLTGSLAAGKYTLTSVDAGNFQPNSPFYAVIPTAKKKFTVKSGKTTSLGNVNLTVKG